MEESTGRWAFRRMNSQPRLPFPGHKAYKRGEGVTRSSPEFLTKYKLATNSVLTTLDFTKRVSNFVLQNPVEWEEYILQNTRLETLNKWQTKKKSMLQQQKENKRENAEDFSEASILGKQASQKVFRLSLFRSVSFINVLIRASRRH